MAKGLWFNNMKQLFLENKSYTLSHFTALKNLLKECCFLLKKILTCRQSPKNNKHTHTHTHIHSHVPTFPNSGTPAESYIPERSTSLNLVILCKEPWEICSTGTGGILANHQKHFDDQNDGRLSEREIWHYTVWWNEGCISPSTKTYFLATSAINQPLFISSD